MDVIDFSKGCAVVDRSDVQKLRLTGPQALWFLDQLVTNKVDELAPGSSTDALLLTPKGRIAASLRIHSTPDAVWAEGLANPGTSLYEFFLGRVFSTEVEIQDVSKDYSILALLGPACESARAGIGTELNFSRERPVGGVDAWIPVTEHDAALAALTDSGVVTATFEDYRAVCADAGVQLFPYDYDEGFLPQEAAMETAVHFSKGCYLGQEAVAMAQRGRVKRRIRHLEFAQEPVMGEIAGDGGEAVGRVTSIGRDFGVGTVSAAVALGSEVLVKGEAGESKAIVRELPEEATGPQVPSGRELREKLSKTEP